MFRGHTLFNLGFECVSFYFPFRLAPPPRVHAYTEAQASCLTPPRMHFGSYCHWILYLIGLMYSTEIALLY
jgi:hypothetical protein